MGGGAVSVIGGSLTRITQGAQPFLLPMMLQLGFGMTAAASDPVLVTENPIFGRTDNPSGLDYAAPGPFATLPSAVRGAPVRAPRLGEHSGDVLSRLLGMGDGEIDALASEGVIALG